MKIFTRIFDKIKIFFRYLLNNLPILVGIAALAVAIVGINNSDKQFKINSATSDSLFNVQLKNSKELNDSLINQLSMLQEITNKQLQITDEQLKISIELLQDQIYSGRPKIVVLSNKIADTTDIIDNLFRPKIVLTYQNIGKRFAFKVAIRSFAISNNISTLNSNLLAKESFLVEPNAKRDHLFRPKIDLKDKNNFYYCYDFIYYDDIVKQNFIQSYYWHYYKFGDKYNFYNCKIVEEKKLKKFINDNLRPMNERLFDQ